MERVVLIDIARVAAIIMLLISHLGDTLHSPLAINFGIPNFYYVSLGGLAVTIFLIISGLTLQLQYGRGRQVSYPLFLFKRIFRIYPIYYMSLLLGLAVYLATMKSQGAAVAKLNLSDIFFSLTGFYAFSGQWGGPFVSTSWFIGLIVVLYILFPAISRSVRKYPNSTLWVLLAISVASRILLGPSTLLSGRPLDWFPLCRIFEFGLGIYLGVRFESSLRTEKIGPYPAKIWQFLGELSFPVFLVHFPLLVIVYFIMKFSAHPSFAVAGYLIATFGLSTVILVLDRHIPRKAVYQMFSNEFLK